MANKPVRGEVKQRGPVKTPLMSSTESRKRREIALMTLREAQAGQLTGKLICREAALTVWSQQCARIRDRVLAIADRMAPTLAPISNATEIRNKLRAECEDALRGLAEDAL